VNMLFRKKDELSDQEIMAGLQAEGNEGQRVTNYLFDKYRGLVYKGMNKYRLSEEDALDVYSDAIIAVGLQVRNGKFRGESKLSTYLFKIYYNRCINKVRDLKAKQLDLVEEMPDYPQAGQSILQAMITQEEVDKLISFLDQLGERCREIILMREYYGYTMDEIAEKIGFKTARSVSAMKARCRAQLKEVIAKAKGIKGFENNEIISD
ncbi:MAG: sigma-70 family RNA polymerase sigma factor, partial [Bacteroidota bacterium]